MALISQATKPSYNGRRMDKTFRPDQFNLDIQHATHPFTNIKKHEQRGPFIIERGEGVYVYDNHGKRYLDGMAGLWCVTLGYGNERLVRAATQQMQKLPYYQLFHHKSQTPSIQLASRLAQLTPPRISHFFFGSSGSEANDTALKLIWYFNNARGRPNKKKIIARNRAYHGASIGGASLCGLPYMHQCFDLPLPQIRHTLCPDYYREGLPGESEAAFAQRCADALEQMILVEGPETVAAFFGEPVMGVAGVIPPPADYWTKIQAVLKKYEVLFVADEVITGFGRTGKMFGADRYQLDPDLMIFAKGLSSAYLPISATGYSEEIHRVVGEKSNEIGHFSHGYTYSGHPTAAAVALAVLDEIEDCNILAQVEETSTYFADRLEKFRDHPLVGNIRQVGLMAAIELVRNKETKASFDPALAVGSTIFEQAQENGVILRYLKDTLLFSPPLIISKKEIDEMLGGFERALHVTERALALTPMA